MTASRRRLNVRAELRLALLAAAESCWIYAVLLTVGTLGGFRSVVSPLGIFLVYLTGLYVGRWLPRSHRQWRLLQVLTVMIAALAILVAVRVSLYADVPILDASWVGDFVSRTLSFTRIITPELLSTIALVFAFTRGLGFAQYPLTLWVVGYQFRLGIVILFAAAFLAAFASGVNFIPWIFVYFALSLTGIALARIEEAGQEQPLGGKWALVLGVALGVTLLFGYAAAQFLTLDNVNTFFELLSPLFIIVQIIITLIAIPLFFLLDLFLRLIDPLLRLLSETLSQLIPRLPVNPEDTRRVVDEVTRQIVLFAPYLRILGILAILGLLAWFIARALKRRVNKAEQDWFEQEEMDEKDSVVLEGRRPRPARLAHREIRAENVRRLYAALLAHAEALGLKRRDAETPLEFLPRLNARFPEVSSELAALTHAYVAVHYAQQSATDAQVKELRGVWKRAREQMKQETRKSKDG